jgi:hypothetical protein
MGAGIEFDVLTQKYPSRPSPPRHQQQQHHPQKPLTTTFKNNNFDLLFVNSKILCNFVRLYA